MLLSPAPLNLLLIWSVELLTFIFLVLSHRRLLPIGSLVIMALHILVLQTWVMLLMSKYLVMIFERSDLYVISSAAVQKNCTDYRCCPDSVV